MRAKLIGGMVLAAGLVAGPTWALTDADSGREWMGAPSPQKVRLANLLSRELSGDPLAYVKCLDEVFANPNNQAMTIREAAMQCKAKQ